MEAFVNENLPWIIAAGALILLTIIGYFAEKTDFGKKRAVSEDKGKKNKKKEKEEINEVQPTVEAPIQPMVTEEVAPAISNEISLDPLAAPVLAPVVEPVAEMVEPVSSLNETVENRVDIGVDSTSISITTTGDYSGYSATICLYYTKD